VLVVLVVSKRWSSQLRNRAAPVVFLHRRGPAFLQTTLHSGTFEQYVSIALGVAGG
jgi:hypothetical protein